jgi:hypothetical protein
MATATRASKSLLLHETTTVRKNNRRGNSNQYFNRRVQSTQLGTMATGEPLGVDEKVNEDYLFFLEYFKESFDGLKSEAEKEICNVKSTPPPTPPPPRNRYN